MIVRIGPRLRGHVKVDIEGTWRITITISDAMQEVVFDFFYIVPEGQSQRSNFIEEERRLAFLDLEKRLLMARANIRHYIIGDLNPSVGDLRQKTGFPKIRKIV